MAKLYDIVETSKMALEYDGSLLDVEGTAGANLENGRLGVKDASGVVAYATATTTEGVKLIMNVERMGKTTNGLTEFRILAGEKVRLGGMRAGDIFRTTAFNASDALKAGDTVVNGADGKFVKGTAGTQAFIGKVLGLGTLGYFSAGFGFEAIPAIKVEVKSVK